MGLANSLNYFLYNDLDAIALAVTITGVDNDDQTGDVIVSVLATATNTSSLGVIEPEPVELAIADDETTPVVSLSLLPSEIIEGERGTVVTATLDNRSGAETTIAVSATPTNPVEEIYSATLTIPAGQTASIGYGVSIYAIDDEDLTDARKTVTVSGTATNRLGVTGPESVTLTVIDDEAPFFADDSIAYTFTEGVAARRVLPEAAHGNGTLTYSLSPMPSNGVTFAPGPPAQLEVSSTAVAGDETSYKLTALDGDGDTGSMTINITIQKGLCLSSTSVSRYSDPGIVADCEALLSSRDTLGGNIALNWHENLSIDGWQGVEIANGRVVGISLSHLGLTGVIPAELGSLANLQRLDLTSNQLTGEIPEELGNLSALESMNLQFNELTGEIPKELGNLANLEELWLRVNQLDEGIPVELGNLSNLRELELSDNQLTGKIPKELGNLANLESLGIHSNHLTGEIPAELGNLANLRSLILSGNELTGGIPTELGKLSNLRVLWIKRNQLTGTIPTELGILSNLEQLILEANLLTGEMPAELGNLSKLEVLWLGYNQLTGSIPTELENLPNLRSLYLSGSQLTGCVPDGLRDVSNNDLVFLSLPFCSENSCVNGGAVPDPNNEGLVSDCGALLTARDVLAGTASLDWSADTPIVDWSGVILDGTSGRVTEILLSDMGLNGKIPKELGSLANLQMLDLSDNKLTGPIPTDLGSLISLQYLNLSDNQLTGAIPTELGDLSNLESLYLGGNRLALCVPDELRDVPNNDLATLGLPFCSEHPCVRGGAVVDATNTGLISDCVVLLAMRDDTLEGTATLNWSADIPIEDWSGVHVRGLPERVEGLLLKHRGLTGEIPVELSSLSNLDYLNLSSNHLTGEIPHELRNLKNLVQLYLSNNQFVGEIPEELGILSELQRLDLSGNNFTGAIPVELGNLSHLRALFLSNNQLTGEIPPELGRLTRLFELTLNSNNLEGGIPASLESLWRLEHLYLGNNRLTGCVPPRLRDVTDNDLDQLGLPFCPLSAPQSITVGFVTSEFDTLVISWSPPLSDGGSEITAYDLRHIETTADETVDSSWTVVEDVWIPGRSALEYTLTGLTGGIQYDIQVRAVNAEGDSPWSETVTGTPSSSVCVSGGAVADATNNPGLVSDCEALLASRDTLAGDATLNWSADNPIADWDGITLDGTPQRVIRLSLFRHGLTGQIPAELGGLSNLQYLFLGDNQLTGEVPPTFGNLTNLKSLSVPDNQLTGSLPRSLANLTSLENMTFLSNAGLCAPIDGAFQTWLKSIDMVLGSSCAPMDSIEDRAVLVELYNALDGANWTKNTNWLSDRPIREWTDVTNDATGRVNGLYLTNNNLSGEIPTALANLSNLQQVYLTGNQLTGEIPAELGSLANLEVLYLVRNQLTGEIPAELGALAKLELMSLWHNQLTGEIPTELSSLANLEGLYLYNNRLTGEIPVELTGLPKLRGLYLHNNQLTGQIPTELGDLTNLQWLNLSQNQLTGEIPVELGSLANMERLYLSQNQLTGTIPEELGNLTNLERLYLNDNQLNGQIPSQLGSLSNLERLYLGGNQLTGCVPEGLRDVPRNDFDQLNLPFCESDCETGVAVSDAANNPGLVSDCEALLASRDTLAGTATLNWSADTPIADWDGVTLEGTPQRVTRLRLSMRGLTGEIPPELGDLTNLERLSLQLNRLSGEIPAELGNLANVQYMQLHYNELTGEVPPDFGGLASLEILLLDNNQLTGMLPQTMTELTLLRFFYFLDNAGLCAPADDAFQTWLQNVDTFRGSTCGSVDSDEDRPALEALYAATNGQNWEESDNWLSERPISEWHGVTVDVNGRVNGLYLSSNDLAGEIPDDLGSLTGLRRLNLGSNDLTGEIPEELGELANLDRLVLSRNQLTGPIPAELSALTNLKWVLLGGNELDGTIPAGIGNLTDLQFLYLDRNGLTGEIPTELGGLVNLERLWLHNNLLTGPIPEEFGNLAKLEQLRLDDNQLTGSIPTELGNLSNLERLYLSGNLFSGCLPSALLSLEDTIENDFNSIGLPHECAVLLADRDTLAGTATLNWSADTPVAQWDGVKLGGTPDRVTRIVLHNEGLNGTVPVSLGRLTRLIDLDLSNNELTGEIPGELGDLYFLRVLNLRTNELTGEIPDELGNLRNLKVLNLHSNSLSGGIPDLSGITGLVELYLPNNADYDVDGDKVEGTGLTGEIPTWLNGMTNMRELWLWGNSLSGSVPDLSGMTSLQKLKLANNDLDGGVPQASTLPPNMTWLIIDRNPFGGTIPDMSSLTRLRLLWLHSSELEGMIPAGDMFPASLDDLNLRDNMLTGTIPDLSGLDTLTRLRLHNNSLSGEVPATLGDLDSLKYLWLHNEDATKSDNGNNMFTSIAAGVGDLADTLIVIALNGNPWADDACVPAALADVARNDYAEAGIAVCSAGDGNGNGN